MPRGGSSVNLTLLWSKPMGKYCTGNGAALKNSLKPGLEKPGLPPRPFTIMSSVGNHEQARWQFCSITQLPFALATCRVDGYQRQTVSESPHVGCWNCGVVLDIVGQSKPFTLIISSARGPCPLPKETSSTLFSIPREEANFISSKTGSAPRERIKTHGVFSSTSENTCR